MSRLRNATHFSRALALTSVLFRVKLSLAGGLFQPRFNLHGVPLNAHAGIEQSAIVSP